MAQDTDRITASCTTCGATLAVDRDNPSKDDDIVYCPGCGREVGTLAQIRTAMVAEGKAQIDKLILERFGKKPTWTKR